MANREKRPMSRRQAENLAKGNPKLKARLDAGEFDNSPGTAPAAPRKPRSAPRKPPVSAGAPPAKPRARSGGTTRPPRTTRDNGQPAQEERRRGGIREFFDGLLGG